MNKTRQYEMEMLTAQMSSIERTLANLLQSPPSVSGKASALVALAKDARLDGRVGAGDVVVSVGLALGGFSIGAIGSAGVFLGGVDIISTGEIFGFSTLAGCGLGLGRMALDALAVPMMLSNIMEWLADRWQEWLEHQVELRANKTTIVEHPLILNPVDDAPMPWESYTQDYADYFITIREETETLDKIDWLYSRLWFFIEDCFNTGEWSRRKVCTRWKAHFGPKEMTQDQHKVIFDFLEKQAPGLWDLKGERNRPTLHAYLKRFRWTDNQPTDQPANNQEKNQ